MKKILLIALSCFFLTGLSAQTDTNYKEKHPYKDWVKIAPKFDDAFFKTPEAIRIADNVLLYQQITGGWPKNIYMAAEAFALVISLKSFITLIMASSLYVIWM